MAQTKAPSCLLVLMCEMQNLLSAAKILFVSVKTQLRQ
jgi:hypothetical protein